MIMNPFRRALRITLIYLLFGVLWILASDAYLESLGLGTKALIWLQSVKGSLFVFVTGLIFFLLAYRELTRQYQADMAASRRLRENEAWLRAIYEGVNDAILIFDPETGAIIDVNHRAEELTGYDIETMRELRIVDLSVGEPEEIDRIAVERMREALRGRPQIFEWQVRARDRGAIWVEVNMRAARIGDLLLLLVLARDISQRRESELKLRLTNQVFHSTREGVLVTDTESRIVSVNPAFTEITGYTEEEVLGSTPKLLQSGMHDRSFYQAMWQSIERSDHWQGELWNRRKSGETYPEWLTISAVRDEQGVITNYVGVFSDISRIKHSEAEVQRLAHYDALTGLPNRVLLMTRLEHALDICKRRGHRAVLLCCGLDRFKHINDSLGYGAGDELLQTVSRRIRGRLQRGDTIARFSGDEFVVLRETTLEEEDIARLAESIVELGMSPVELSDGQNVFIGISVGISVYPEDGDDPDSLVTRANTAMQQAKYEGRHTYRFYKQELTDAARARLQLESRLRRAVDENQFQLFYQPIVDVRSGRITGAEALVRWIDPELGTIMPDRFIPVAEDTALILPLGRWVLETACRQAAKWAETGHAGLRIAVNLSSRQFESGALHEEVAVILENACTDPRRLELEITESMLMEQGAPSMEILKSLRRAGVGVSIDDFGTGYSSLAYLKRFAISKLKIDRMFINDLPADHDDAEIVAAIIAMAHNLNLQVIAEGVETPGQLEFLKELGCDEFQGYLVSPPVPAAQFEALLG